jgi:class 3 adenylate cyclase
MNEQGGDPAITAQLRRHLSTAADDAVGQMRPFPLADSWGTDRRATLIVFLRAATVGLLDMRWEVLCPHCRAPSAEYSSLSDLDHQGHCEKCNASYDANFDRLVEVRFRVSPSIRRATTEVYCIGGPQNMPHIAAQASIPGGGAVDWSVVLERPVYRLRSPQSASSAIIEAIADPSDTAPGGGEPATFVLGAEGIHPTQARIAGGLASIRIESRLRGAAKVSLEEQFWPEDAATAAVVSTLQEFRDLFSSEVLAAGIEVAIERLALLFTDLAGSTQLYERIGQARAFGLVHEHFRLIEAAVRAENGAVVKTIGDAVMAVFPATSDAVHAAIEMQRRMADLDPPEGTDPTRLLKVGIHVGPCMVVTLNDRLDYFGTAVNMAARVEHEAVGGEIVLSEAAWEDIGVADVLQGAQIAAEQCQRCEVQLRGIARPVGIVRIGPAPSGMAPDGP